MSINIQELEIFSRQIIMNDFNEISINKLQTKEISIIGIGGIGCPLSQYLISCGIKNLNLFDNDIVKINNLNRQTLYGFKDIGDEKTAVAKKKLLETNPYANISIYNKKITKNNLNLLKSSSIVIDASDDWTTMKLINKYCLGNNIPLLSSSAVGYNTQIVLFENHNDKHLCLNCLFPNESEPELARCETVGILGTVAGLAGIISAQKTINFLMEFNNSNNFLTLIDSKTLSINQIKIDKNINCKLL
jgi:molybdopterin/thiamine biosynthesis adenylyltransferase